MKTNYMDHYGILQEINVKNYDDGVKFTCEDRLDAIDRIIADKKSKYHRIDTGKQLVHLYAKVPAAELSEQILVVSSHVDCHENITDCFTQEYNTDMLLGTFDNSITNAAAVIAMLKADLPEHVVFAFTGNEEHGCEGANMTAEFFDHLHKDITVMVLDVTDMGWSEKYDFNIENAFWNPDTGESVMKLISDHANWGFVPENIFYIDGYIPVERVILKDAEEDESWQYDEHRINCFSLCIPVNGEMHSNEGVYVRKEAWESYIEALTKLAGSLVTD